MANLDNAKKMIRTTSKRTKRNQIWRSRVKEVVKDLSTKVKKDEKVAGKDLAKLYKVVDKAAKRNVIHPNRAARIKSRITKKAMKQ